MTEEITDNDIAKTTTTSGVKTAFSGALAVVIVEVLRVIEPELATPTMAVALTTVFRTFLTWIKHK